MPHSMSARAVLGGTLLLILTCAGRAPAGFSIVDLGVVGSPPPPQNPIGSAAYGINASGQVTGASFTGGTVPSAVAAMTPGQPFQALSMPGFVGASQGNARQKQRRRR